jgi:hypothetical protein
MDITGPEDRDREPAHEPPSGRADRRPPILAPLGELIADLSRARVGPMPAGREGEPPTRWRDDKNLYMNFDLRDAIDIDVDINVCYGKVYIRVAR